MGKIFYRRQEIDTIKFLFDRLSKDSFVVVPDQYSFYVERQSFIKLNKSAVLGMDIMGFSRLGEKILRKAGVKVEKINSEGKNMLISKIAMENKDDFKMFKDFSTKSDFPNMMQDTIRQFKQMNFTREDYEMLRGSLANSTPLRNKLDDIFLVFEKYNELMRGSFVDAQDFADIYNKEIEKADFLENIDIWICGFDFFDEKRLETIRLLNKKAKSLNIIMTYEEGQNEPDIFEGVDSSIFRLKEAIKDGMPISDSEILFKIDNAYLIEGQNEDISFLEKNLFSINQVEKKFVDKKENSSVEIIKCANPYSQAVAAASFIHKLIRENKDLRLRDIAILSNTIEEEKALYKNVFSDFGIDIFIDEKKSIYGNKIVFYIQSLLDVIKTDFKREYVIEYLKNQVGEDTRLIDEIENLELYCNTYDIDKRLWLQPFKKGKKDYGEERLNEFNIIRESLVLPIFMLNEELLDKISVSEKLEHLKEFLITEGKIIERVDELVSQDENSAEEILETKQIWNKVIDVMRQMSLLIGGESFTLSKTIEILLEGISSIELGIIPPRTDSLIIGDLSRVKKGISKVTLILSANDGILPYKESEKGFITEDDMRVLGVEGNNFEKPLISSSNQYLDLYKNIGSTKDRLYFSYLSTDNSGNTLEKSEIITRIEELLLIEEGLDPISSKDFHLLVGGKKLAVSLIIEEFYNAFIEKRSVDGFIQKLYNHIPKDENLVNIIESILEPFGYMDIDKALIRNLYLNEETYMKMSPSRLEYFGKCPFAHFINYGIRPEVIRDYKVEGVDLGNIYHDCIKIFSEEMSKNNMKGWKSSYGEDEISKEIDKILDNLLQTYREGILVEDGEGEYRAERIRAVCKAVATNIYNEVAEDNINKMLFEIGFGRKKMIPEIKILSTDEEIEVGIEGQIDRLDILGKKSSRIIDYKSGNDKFNLENSLRGLSLQLFIYLMASENLSFEGESLVPSGSFYFPVKDSLTDSSTSSEKMDGFWREEINNSISENFFVKHKSRVLNVEDFNKTLKEVRNKIERMAKEIIDGKVDALPKEFNNMNSCTYCSFKGICKFDTSVSGCIYNRLEDRIN